MSILKKKKNNAYPLHIKKMKLKIFRLKKIHLYVKEWKNKKKNFNIFCIPLMFWFNICFIVKDSFFSSTKLFYGKKNS